MLNVKTEKKGNLLVAVLDGVIDDTTDLEKLIGPPPAALQVQCGGVTRVNSVGVKAWIKYFEKCQYRGCKLELVDCSPVIVQQLNLMVSFACGGTVSSFQISYSCEKCGKIFARTYLSDMIRKAKYEVPESPCPHCGGAGVFDDFPEEYFRFLQR